jgi:hypothetical protein
MTDFKKELPQVATGWLLLSHGVFLTAAIACNSIAVNQIEIFPTHTNLQAMSFGWIGVSLMFILFTSVMLYRTWEANREFDHAVFHSFDFLFFGLLIVFTFALTIWTLIVIASF